MGINMKNNINHGLDALDILAIIVFGALWVIFVWLLYSTHISDNILGAGGIVLGVYLITDMLKRLFVQARRNKEG